ncbi:MAG: DUF4040 domain-containing protein [Cyanobacteria bacterium J06598_1]
MNDILLSDFLGDDFYIVAITALLPLTAGLLVVQVNPYHALVIRGILGAIAALIYALFGAADVALTEALVGTMLSITLYAIAVRSSMTVRIGIVEQEDSIEEKSNGEKSVEKVSVKKTSIEKVSKDSTLNFPQPLDPTQLLSTISPVLDKYHVRLELWRYPDSHALSAALTQKEIHVAYGESQNAPAAIQTRIQRLYDILRAGLPPTIPLNYLEAASLSQSDIKQPDLSNLSRSQS